MGYKRILCIGDAHADPTQGDMRRFSVLSNFIASERPEVVVQMGDWCNYDSVSFHNHGRPLLRENLRLADDIAAAKTAYALTMSGLKEYNERAKLLKSKRYSPTLVWLQANHEVRVRNYIITQPLLEGLVDTDDLVGVKPDGWELVPYHKRYSAGGVSFTHVPINRHDARPVSGKYVGHKAFDLYQGSVVFGHTHRLSVTTNRRVGDKQLTYSVNVGWYGDYVPNYITNPENLDWWAGLVILYCSDEGIEEVRTLSMDYLNENYGV